MTTYEDVVEHRFSPGEEAVWTDFFVRHLPGLPGAAVLDAGCGTGLLTMLLAGHGATVDGLDNDAGQLAVARDKRVAAPGLRDRIRFVEGDLEDGGLFGADRFDWIASRQAVCYVRRPARTFQAWRTWLRPGGGVFLVDGYWRPWEGGDGPFATVTSPAPLSRALALAGFEVRLSRPMHEVNDHRRGQDVGRADRYVVVAVRP